MNDVVRIFLKNWIISRTDFLLSIVLIVTPDRTWAEIGLVNLQRNIFLQANSTRNAIFSVGLCYLVYSFTSDFCHLCFLIILKNPYLSCLRLLHFVGLFDDVVSRLRRRDDIILRIWRRISAAQNARTVSDVHIASAVLLRQTVKALKLA